MKRRDAIKTHSILSSPSSSLVVSRPIDRVQTKGKKGNETKMKQLTANKQRTTPCDEVETPRMMGNAVCQVPSQIAIDKRKFPIP
eukprot:scaffold741_cov85-Amphora_coffeaeformis.AAC.1